MAKTEGTRELSHKFFELANSKEMYQAMRASVRDPMRDVMKRARSNILSISPGERDAHLTYKGRLVTAGFASRSVRMAVRQTKGVVYAVVGLLAEAFYALQFFELGTSTIPPQPWLVPAFLASKDDALRKMGEALLSKIEQIAAKRVA